MNTENCHSFESLFNGCSSLSNIKSLQNWNDSKGTNFRGMFQECSSLSEIEPLQNWNFKNGEDF